MGVCSFVVDWLASTWERGNRLENDTQFVQDAHAFAMSDKEVEEGAVPRQQSTPSTSQARQMMAGRRQSSSPTMRRGRPQHTKVFPTRKEIAR